MTVMTIKNQGKILNIKIKDVYFIMDVINEYNEGRFLEMTNMIKEFGVHEFFQQLYELFNAQTWRNLTNKYLTFVGIIIEFEKYNYDLWINKT